MEKAMDIYAKLMMGEEIKRGQGTNKELYEEYIQNPEVYDVLELMLKRLNLHLYEHNEGLYLTAGDGNRIFGYTNDDLKRVMSLNNNKQLYMTYYIMYQIILFFYSDTGSYVFAEYVTLSQAVEKVSTSLRQTIHDLAMLVKDEVEEHSFKSVALTWDELPLQSAEDNQGVRAARNSRMGLTKVVFNFLVSQNLFVEMEERYYPTDRLKALAQNYFEENRGRLYEILKKEED